MNNSPNYIWNFTLFALMVILIYTISSLREKITTSTFNIVDAIRDLKKYEDGDVSSIGLTSGQIIIWGEQK